MHALVRLFLSVLCYRTSLTVPPYFGSRVSLPYLTLPHLTLPCLTLPWEQGILGMRVGGTRRLVVPASLGYGARGSGPVGPNATLVFEVSLLNCVGGA